MEAKKFTAKEIEEILPISAQVLETLFNRGLGPKADRDAEGNLVYTLDEVERWLAETKVWNEPF